MDEVCGLPVTLHVASQFFLPTTIANPKYFFGFSSRITSKFILSFVAHRARHSIMYHSWPFSLLRIQICLLSRLAHYTRPRVFTLCKSLYLLLTLKKIYYYSRNCDNLFSALRCAVHFPLSILSSVVLRHRSYT